MVPSPVPPVWTCEEQPEPGPSVAAANVALSRQTRIAQLCGMACLWDNTVYRIPVYRRSSTSESLCLDRVIKRIETVCHGKYVSINLL